MIAVALSSCSLADCTTTNTVHSAPGEQVVAIERVISCGGAAGSLDAEVLLAPAGADAEAETVVVATTGPVYAVEWQDARTLVVEVAPADEFGDPVSEYLERYGQIRIVLKRVEPAAST